MPSHNSKTFLFFDLPPELRDQIYDYIFELRTTHITFACIAVPMGLDSRISASYPLPACFFVNKQFSTEYQKRAATFVGTDVTITVLRSVDFGHAPRILGKKMQNCHKLLRHVRRIHVIVRSNCIWLTQGVVVDSFLREMPVVEWLRVSHRFLDSILEGRFAAENLSYLTRLLSYDIAGRWTDRPLKREEKVLVKFDWKVKGRDGEIIVRKVDVWNVAARTMEKTSWTADSLAVAKPGGLVAWSRFQTALKA